MKTISILFALTAMCLGKPSSVVVRDDSNPYASMTVSVPGIYQPTSTNSAVVAAYAQTVQACGPDEDAALQKLLASGDYQSETGDTRDNITITDTAFNAWAVQQPTFSTVSLRCEGDEDNLGAVAVSVKQASESLAAQSSASGSVTTTGQSPSRAPSGTSTLTESAAASNATKSGLAGGGVVQRAQPVALIVSAAGSLAWLY
ncbi:hypothetical protein B0H16DRAFT_1891812 [Mycena metata]|uniref:Uncharacterized protein n=1 Tax=Mycena metata TaxID=1033252 RepID=A0AAD7MYW9_9AGAR|nr:hypothetical protein B0H16DRAFT_1891812 [Mycena metata]